MVQVSSLCVIRRLANLHAKLFHPLGFVLAVHDATEETESLSNVVAVESDVLPGGLRILPHPIRYIGRFREHIGRVPRLRYLDDHRFFE